MRRGRVSEITILVQIPLHSKPLPGPALAASPVRRGRSSEITILAQILLYSKPLAGWLGWPGGASWLAGLAGPGGGRPGKLVPLSGGGQNLLGGPTRLLDSNCRTVQDLGRMVHVKHRGCLPAWICTSDQSWLRGTVHWHPRQGTPHSRVAPEGQRGPADSLHSGSGGGFQKST